MKIEIPHFFWNTLYTHDAKLPKRKVTSYPFSHSSFRLMVEIVFERQAKKIQRKNLTRGIVGQSKMSITKVGKDICVRPLMI